jgi:hypothetical protein
MDINHVLYSFGQPGAKVLTSIGGYCSYTEYLLHMYMENSKMHFLPWQQASGYSVRDAGGCMMASLQ